MKRPRQRSKATRSRTKPRKSRRVAPYRLRIPVSDGMRNIGVETLEDASLVGSYWNAVHTYVAHGDASALEPFEGLSIRSRTGEDHVLLTDPKTLDRLAGAGVLSFESIYARRV